MCKDCENKYEPHAATHSPSGADYVRGSNPIGEMMGKAIYEDQERKFADYAAGVGGPPEPASFDVDVSVSGTAPVEDLTDEQIETISKGVAERLLRQRAEAREAAAADEEEIDLDEMFPADLAAMLAHELVESTYYDADNLIAGLRRFIRDASATARG